MQCIDLQMLHFIDWTAQGQVVSVKCASIQLPVCIEVTQVSATFAGINEDGNSLLFSL